MTVLSTRALVRRRAGHRCEYCHVLEADDPLLPFHVEHIIPRKHGGTDSLRNLALACHHDNLHKGSNLTGIDHATRTVTKLFNPRRHKWSRHFRWDGPTLMGRTAIGRATIAVLGMNLLHRIALREELIGANRFPAE